MTQQPPSSARGEMRTAASLLLLLLGFVAGLSHGFLLPLTTTTTGRSARMATMTAAERPATSSTTSSSRHVSLSRREAAQRLLLGGAGAGALLLLGVTASPLPSVAAAGASASSFFPQVVAGYKELAAMAGPEWAATEAKGGDEVRRRLGIVGVKSPLFKIDKAFKVIQEAVLDGELGDIDPMEFVDLSQKVLDGIKNADFLAYSNNFSSYGNGGGGTNYLEESHKVMGPTLEAYKQLIDLLGLKL